ncbi:MAG: DNA circularization N-terminal domain-containing protein [Betaproteobacteria bacterium]|nr:DNA circularization N-terminal domain-containing protein [Betaproteobacteria bacterium]
MTWRDRIQSNSVDGQPLLGSFRGARFVVPENDLEFGRRKQVHEYPKRDTPYVEDIGRKARRFSVQVFVDGSITADGDYIPARDALIAAIEEAGPGTLVHPWYGSLRVDVVESSVRESTREGGRAAFQLAFVEAGEAIFPTATVQTASQVEAAADAALETVQADFEQAWDVDKLPGFSLAELAAEIDRTLAEDERWVAGAVDSVAAQIRAPGNMAAALVGAVRRLADATSAPLRAISLYKTLFGAGSSSPAVPTTTPTRRRQAASTAALHAAVQRSAVIEACRASSRAGYMSRDDALTVRASLLDALDDQMEAVDAVAGAPVSDDVYQALAALRAAVAEDLRVRGARLPELTTITLGAPMPALVVAYRVFGNAARDTEIVERNHIRHPGYVPGGRPLEVING